MAGEGFRDRRPLPLPGPPLLGKLACVYQDGPLAHCLPIFALLLPETKTHHSYTKSPAVIYSSHCRSGLNFLPWDTPPLIPARFDCTQKLSSFVDHGLWFAELPKGLLGIAAKGSCLFAKHETVTYIKVGKHLSQ